MKKILLFVSLLITATTVSFSQPRQSRAGNSVTAVDKNVIIDSSLGLPRFPDTIRATISLDSCGKVVYIYGSGIWYRECMPVKHWARLSSTTVSIPDISGLQDSLNSKWIRNGTNSIHTKNITDNVGIGTTVPFYRFHLKSTSGPFALFERSVASVSAGNFIDLWNPDSTTNGSGSVIRGLGNTTGTGRTESAVAGIGFRMTQHNHATRRGEVVFLTTDGTYNTGNAIKAKFDHKGYLGLGEVTGGQGVPVVYERLYNTGKSRLDSIAYYNGDHSATFNTTDTALPSVKWVKDKIAAEIAAASFIGGTDTTIVTPISFGAVRDGVTDDRAAIQAAINYAGATNKRLMLIGTYAIDSTLTMSYNNMNVSSGGLKMLTANRTMLRITGNGNIVQYMKFDGNQASIVSPTQASIGICIEGDNNTINSVEITKVASTGIKVMDAWNTTINSPYIHDMGIASVSNGIYLNANLVEGTKNTGIINPIISHINYNGLDTTYDANGIQIQGVSTIDSIGEHKSVSNTTITGGYIGYTSARGIKSQEGHLNINGTVITHAALGFALANWGLMKNVIVDNVRIDSCKIAISGSSGETDNYKITNSIFTNLINTGFRASSGGVNKNILFSHNAVENTGGSSIALGGAGNSGKIIGNTFTNWGKNTSETNRRGVSIAGGAGNFNISDNTWNGYVAAVGVQPDDALDLDSNVDSAQYIISNNIFNIKNISGNALNKSGGFAWTRVIAFNNATNKAGDNSFNFLTAGDYGNFTITNQGRITAASTTVTAPMFQGGTSTTSDLFLKTTSGVGATGADAHILVGNNGATEAVTVLNNGNVGIGNTAPADKLVVENNANSALISTVTNTSTGTSAEAALNLKNSSGNAYWELFSSGFSTTARRLQSLFTTTSGLTGGIGFATLGNAPIRFLTNGIANERMIIEGGGNVGIGTLTPTSTLHTTSFSTAYTASAVDITATIAHKTIALTATTKIATLPTAVGITGREYTIKLTASGTGTVATTSSQTIDGVTTYTLSAQYKYVTVQSDGANWIIIGNN